MRQTPLNHTRWCAKVAVIAAMTAVGTLAMLLSACSGIQLPAATAKTPQTSETILQSNIPSTDIPVVAPSNPNIIYMAMNANGASELERSSDSGRTYTKLTLPQHQSVSLAGGFINLAVSPIDASRVFLHFRDDQSQGVGFCRQYDICGDWYYSSDMGDTWKVFTIPNNVDEFTDFNPYAPATFLPQPQGKRLYTLTTAINNQSVGIVASDDDGLTWNPIPAPTTDAGSGLSSIAAQSTGRMLYALLYVTRQSSPYQLYRSDDGAQTWIKAPALANPSNIYVGASDVLYCESFVGGYRIEALASQDNGGTFTAAPNAGFPANDNTVKALGTLHDGSILISAYNRKSGDPLILDGLYTWKPGQRTWTPLPQTALPGSIESSVITPSATGDTLTLVIFVFQDGQASQKIIRLSISQ